MKISRCHGTIGRPVGSEPLVAGSNPTTNIFIVLRMATLFAMRQPLGARRLVFNTSLRFFICECLSVATDEIQLT